MGGKSRKKGGVSKKLINQIKSGKYKPLNKRGTNASCTTTPEKKKGGLFDK
jgi:hypothetical protein